MCADRARVAFKRGRGMCRLQNSLKFESWVGLAGWSRARLRLCPPSGCPCLRERGRQRLKGGWRKRSVAEVWWWLFMWGDGVRGLAEAQGPGSRLDLPLDVWIWG